LILSNLISISLFGFLLWLNHSVISFVLLLLLLLLINAVRIYSWSQM